MKFRLGNFKQIALLCLGIISLFSYPLKSYAIPATYPFGGNVTAYTYCICSDNFLVTIGPPRPGVFIYQPTFPGYPGGTDLRAFWSILSLGANVVGLAEDVPMTCWQYVGTACTIFGSGPMMLIAGTSYPI